MVNVTQRIRQVKQPYGGYVNPKSMEVRHLTSDTTTLLDHTIENVHASLVGLAVDYLTRWSLDHTKSPDIPSAEYAFNFSCFGARLIDKQFGTSYAKRAADLCRLIDNSRAFNPNEPTLPTPAAITAAVELASFDVAFRAGVQAYNPDAAITPNAITIQHIEIMVARSLAFFREYGPVLVDGFLMLGGYTETVHAGDGDFLTLDTLWDFKVSVNPPTSAHTLQLLMYWLMGQHGGWQWQALWPEPAEDIDDLIEMGLYEPKFHGGPIPTHLGVYNPRLNTVYRIPISTIPAEVLAEVSRDVIGYV